VVVEKKEMRKGREIDVAPGVSVSGEANGEGGSHANVRKAVTGQKKRAVARH